MRLEYASCDQLLVTQTLVFPRCRPARDFLIPELSYCELLLCPRHFSFLFIPLPPFSFTNTPICLLCFFSSSRGYSTLGYVLAEERTS